MRLLLIPPYFPRPDDDAAGVWPYQRARALGEYLRSVGGELRVAALYPWSPVWLHTAGRLLGRSLRPLPPASHHWGPFKAEYIPAPTWLRGRYRRWAFRHADAYQDRVWRWTRPALLKLLAGFRPDAVLAETAWMPGGLAARLFDEAGVPFAVCEHDVDEIAECANFPARYRAHRRVYDRTGAVIAVSGLVADAFSRPFPDVRPTVIPNGINPEDLGDRLTTVKPPPVGSSAEPTVFCAARFYPRKLVPELVRALSVARQRVPGARLVIAGRGEDEPAIHEAIDREGLREAVELLGPLPHQRVLDRMRSADVFALISDREAWGLVYIEAMATGTPVLLTEAVGVAEVIEDGVHGRVVPPHRPDLAGEALADLLADRAATHAMGARAQQLVRDRFTWPAVARTMVQTLKGLRGAPLSPGR